MTQGTVHKDELDQAVYTRHTRQIHKSRANISRVRLKKKKDSISKDAEGTLKITEISDVCVPQRMCVRKALQVDHVAGHKENLNTVPQEILPSTFTQ